jgi:hypothetical protein
VAAFELSQIIQKLCCVLIEPVSASGEMHEHPVEGLGYVWIDLLQIDYPIIENNIQIVFAQRGDKRASLPPEFRHENIAPPCQEYQDIAQTKEVITVYVFPVPVIGIKVDPAVTAAFPVNQYVIPSYVAMPFPFLMQKMDGLDAFKKVIQDIWEFLIIVSLVIHPNISDIDGKGLPYNKIQYANEIALGIPNRISVHEVLVTGDQIKDSGLFLGVSEALKFDVPDTKHEFFIEDQFHYL